MNPIRVPDGAGFLVAVSDMVVAEDIIVTISELHPGAEVRAARSLEAAEALLGADTGIAVAILEARPAELCASRTGALLEARGARVLLLVDGHGDAAETNGTVSAFLPKPFTTDALIAALRRVDATRAAPET